MNREYFERVLAAYRASVEQAQTLQKTQPIWSGERRAALQTWPIMSPTSVG